MIEARGCPAPVGTGRRASVVPLDDVFRVEQVLVLMDEAGYIAAVVHDAIGIAEETLDGFEMLGAELSDPGALWVFAFE